MAKSNLKILNLNYITQYSNNILDSKYSYTYYSHFFLYFNFIFLAASVSTNFKISQNWQYPASVSYVNKNFTKLRRYIQTKTINKKTTIELDVSIYNINNRLLIVHNIYPLHRSSINTTVNKSGRARYVLNTNKLLKTFTNKTLYTSGTLNSVKLF